MDIVARKAAWWSDGELVHLAVGSGQDFISEGRLRQSQ